MQFPAVAQAAQEVNEDRPAPAQLLRPILAERIRDKGPAYSLMRHKRFVARFDHLSCQESIFAILDWNPENIAVFEHRLQFLQNRSAVRGQAAGKAHDRVE